MALHAPMRFPTDFPKAFSKDFPKGFLKEFKQIQVVSVGLEFHKNSMQSMQPHPDGAVIALQCNRFRLHYWPSSVLRN